MVTIREEKFADVAAREALLDEAYGAARFAKTSERLREGRLPADGLSLVAVRSWPDRRHGPAVECRGRSTARRAAARAARGSSGARNRGIGSTLMRRAIARARLAGHRAILLVGDAAYYGRFGFRRGLDRRTVDARAVSSATGSWRSSLSAGALGGARGLIGATGKSAPAPD